jgi:hypothetical protein
MIFEDISVQPLITIRLPLYPSRKWNLPRLRLLLGVLGFSSSNCFVFRNHRENGRPPVEPLLSIISHLY